MSAVCFQKGQCGAVFAGGKFQLIAPVREHDYIVVITAHIHHTDLHQPAPRDGRTCLSGFQQYGVVTRLHDFKIRAAHLQSTFVPLLLCQFRLVTDFIKVGFTGDFGTFHFQIPNISDNDTPPVHPQHDGISPELLQIHPVSLYPGAEAVQCLV